MIFLHVLATFDFLFWPLEMTFWHRSQVLNKQILFFSKFCCAANVRVTNEMKIILKFILTRLFCSIFLYVNYYNRNFWISRGDENRFGPGLNKIYMENLGLHRRGGGKVQPLQHWARELARRDSAELIHSSAVNTILRWINQIMKSIWTIFIPLSK